jgi:hypothetical protein
MNERGGIISGFLVKLVIVLGLFAFVAFEFGAIVVAKVQVDGIAVNAAQEAASQYGKDQNLNHAKAAAKQIATESGAELVSLVVSPDGALVTVTIRKIAHTFILQHIKKFASWRVATSTHQAGVH